MECRSFHDTLRFIGDLSDRLSSLPADLASSPGQYSSRFTAALQRMCNSAAPLLHCACDITRPDRPLSGNLTDTIGEADMDVKRAHLVELLLGSDARADVVDPSGDTPAHKVALSCVKAAQEVTKGKAGAAVRYASFVVALGALIRKGAHNAAHGLVQPSSPDPHAAAGAAVARGGCRAGA